MQRIIFWLVRRYIGAPGRSWVFTAAAALLMRLVRSTVGRRQTLDLSDVKPGDKVVIEHLPISHKQQIRQFRRERKDDSGAVSKLVSRVARK